MPSNNATRWMSVLLFPPTETSGITAAAHSETTSPLAVMTAGEAPRALFLRKRNIILAGIGASTAHSFGFLDVFIGLENIGVDRDERFFRALNEAAYNHDEMGSVCARISSPVNNMTKDEIIAAMEVDCAEHILAMTFSCFSPRGAMHCGECEGCQERRDAFASAKVEDPTEYAQ